MIRSFPCTCRKCEPFLTIEDHKPCRVKGLLHMFLLFHVLECFHSLEKYSFSKRSFIFLCLLSLVKSGYGGASQVNLWVEEIFISYSQRPLFLTADCSSEVQGLLKRWSILFCFVFFSPHCPNNSSSYTFFSCCSIFQQLFSRSDRCLFSSLLGIEAMSRPTGKDIYWRQSDPSGQTEFWLVVQEFRRFFFVQQMDVWQQWSSWQLHSFSFLLHVGRWFCCLCWDLDLK